MISSLERQPLGFVLTKDTHLSSQVKPSNVHCLATGGKWCWLNYESQPYYTLVINVRDSGDGHLSKNFAINITLKDINDSPRNLDLSGRRVQENLPAGTVIGVFTATEEDTLNILTYVLIDDDGGRFLLVGNQLQKAKSFDYETNETHSVTVMVRDDGNPSLSVSVKIEKRWLHAFISTTPSFKALKLSRSHGQQCVSSVWV